MNKNRKTNRLYNFDYTNIGNYFVTICTKDRISWFGEIRNNRIVLNEIGNWCKKCWMDIPNHFPHMVLDEFVIMPNHIHGIVSIIENIVGDNNYCSLRDGQFQTLRDHYSVQNNTEIPWQTKWSKTISSAIRGFKIGVMKWCRQNNYDEFMWQKSFFDRIIRTEEELENVKKYIYNNPRNWEEDENFNDKDNNMVLQWKICRE